MPRGVLGRFRNFPGRQSAPDVVALLPAIKVSIDITYDVDSPDLGPLSDCIVDLDPDCTDARLILTYGPRPTAPALLFSGVAVGDDVAVNRLNLFRAVSAGLSGAYEASLEAVDPNDPTNRKALEPKTLTMLIRGGFINAQRGLDDDTHRERDVLGKIVEVLSNLHSPTRSTLRSGLRPSS